MRANLPGVMQQRFHGINFVLLRGITMPIGVQVCMSTFVIRACGKPSVPLLILKSRKGKNITSYHAVCLKVVADLFRVKDGIPKRLSCVDVCRVYCIYCKDF